jgi:hypothetical protein
MKNASLSVLCLAVISWLLCRPDALANDRSGEQVSTCDTLRTRPRGFDVRYEGTIRNDDYRFTAAIPSQLVGWGADGDAPFHGFMIYLSNDGDLQSCIVFSIAVHVDLFDDERKSRSRVKKIKGHGWTGVETTTRGLSHGISFDTIDVTFSKSRVIPVKEGKPIYGIDDVGVTLVTPTEDRQRTEAIFRQFLSELSFW